MKSEIRSTKHETNSKFKFSNVQNNFFPESNYRFGHLDFENLKIVSDFDIRISDFETTAKDLEDLLVIRSHFNLNLSLRVPPSRLREIVAVQQCRVDPPEPASPFVAQPALLTWKQSLEG